MVDDLKSMIEKRALQSAIIDRQSEIRTLLGIASACAAEQSAAPGRETVE